LPGPSSSKRSAAAHSAPVKNVIGQVQADPGRSFTSIRAVQSWDVREIDAPAGTRLAAVLETVDGARAIIIRLAPGEELGDHQVRERAWLMVAEGTARVVASADVVEAGPGTLLTFEPGERHSVASVSGARIVMILSSWPAEDHYPDWPGEDFPTSRTA
jgi:quercetin dioxygenase-like cupin family protein